MVYTMQNLIDKYKDIDSNFQLLPGVNGHVMFIPRRVPSFYAGEILAKSDPNLGKSLRESVFKIKTVASYLKNSKNVSDLGVKSIQTALNTAVCNWMASWDKVASGLAGGYSTHQIEQMSKAIASNATMSGSGLHNLKKWQKNVKHIQLRLHGPKGLGKNINLALKPPYPDVVNRTRGGATQLTQLELNLETIKDQKNLFDIITTNKKEITLIFFIGGMLYLFFKKFASLKIFYHKIRNKI